MRFYLKGQEFDTVGEILEYLMDYLTVSLIALLTFCLGGFAGSRYRKARLEGATRAQALKVVIQGGGGPLPIK